MGNLYDKVDLTKEGNSKFVKDCASLGIPMSLAKNTIGVLSYSGYALFKYDLEGMLTQYYIMNEDGIKLSCSEDSLYDIIEFAIDDVVKEIEFDLKENCKLGEDTHHMLNECGAMLDRMFTTYCKITPRKLPLTKTIYYSNLVKIAKTDFSK